MGICVMAFPQVKLTYPDVIKRLYDMEYLATPPGKGEQSGNFSSFDRQATYSPTTKTYENWGANSDGTGFIRKEGNGIVVFEKDGPGVIWRVWSALAQNGNIKIYIDHAAKPVYDKPFKDFFEKFDELLPPINLPNLSMTLSRGRNRFIPIPFNKHCKIVLEEGWGLYYDIAYTVFPSETQLPVFDGTYNKVTSVSLAETDRDLANRGYERKMYPDETKERSVVHIPGNSTAQLITLNGNKAITHFKIRYDEEQYTTASDKEEMLRNIWIKMTWDDDSKPSVMTPVGMFFGTFPSIYPYRAYPVGVLPGYFYSNWYMPFAKKATLEIVNKGNKTHDISFDIVHIPLKQSAAELLRFHAKWHDGRFKEKVQSGNREIDWPLLVTGGRGRFCGITLHVLNEWENPKDEAKTWWYGAWDKKTIDWWWGEGDEKFYVDGEKFPSTFGTGSEDYIGYAWSAEPPFSLFDSPFATQPYTAIDGNGHTIVSRFHIADNIPFQQSFTAAIEKYKEDKWGDQNKCLYQAVGYWYLAPGQSDDY